MDIQEFRKTHPLPERVYEVAMDAARLARKILGPQVRVIWYGSWIRGNARPRSDIDLAVWPRTPIPSHGMGSLLMSLEDFPALYFVSFVNLKESGADFRKEVFGTGVEI